MRFNTFYSPLPLPLSISLWLLPVLFLIATMGCEPTPNTPTQKMGETQPDEPIEAHPAPDLVKRVQKGHHLGEFLAKDAINFGMTLTFNGSNRYMGEMTLETDYSGIRMDRNDGTTLYYNGAEVYQSPDTVEYPGARFNIFTWSYFFAMPYKLTDPGANWEITGPKMLDGKEYLTGKLTFEENVGDSPDDWYLVYVDPDTRLLHAAAYIVTYGDKTKAKAEEDPHIIVYTDYREIEGIPIAHRWDFHAWSEAEGLGDKLGECTFSDVKFTQASGDFYEAPESGSKRVLLQ